MATAATIFKWNILSHKLPDHFGLELGHTFLMMLTANSDKMGTQPCPPPIELKQVVSAYNG